MSKEYIEFLENMFILFSKTYTETWEELMKDGSDKWLSIPRIQGSGLTLMIDKIAKSTKTKGNFSWEQLKLLEDNLKSKYGSDEE